MENEMHSMRKDITLIRRDIELVKRILLSREEDGEVELTEWAKRELAKAREEKEEDYTSLDEL